MRPRTLRILAGIASLILLGTAFLHSTGHASLSSAVAASSLRGMFRTVIPGIWLFFSWHLIALAAAAAWIAISASQNARPLLVFCACVATVDTIFVFSLAGVFPGTILLSVASILLIVCATRWPRAVAS